MLSFIEAFMYLCFGILVFASILYVMASITGAIASFFLDQKEAYDIKHHREKEQLEPEPYQVPYQMVMTHEEYRDYLKTDAWRATRMLRLAIDNYTCQVCEANLLPNILKPDIAHIHHMHYRNLGHEDVKNDLVSLCKHCHTSMHEKFSIYDMETEINFIRMTRQ